jgi:hypothetical protein
MFEIILLLFIGLFLLGIVALVVLYAYWFQKKNTVFTQTFADKFQFHLEIPKSKLFGYPLIHGVYRDHELRIFTFQNKSFDMHDLFTVIEIAVQESGEFAFAIQERNLLSKLNPAFRHFEEITTGDEHFDRRFILKTNDPDKLKTLLTENIRNRFLNLTEKFSFLNVTFDGSVLVTKRQGTMISDRVRESIEEMMNVMVEIAYPLKPITSAV